MKRAMPQMTKMGPTTVHAHDRAVLAVVVTSWKIRAAF